MLNTTNTQNSSVQTYNQPQTSPPQTQNDFSSDVLQKRIQNSYKKGQAIFLQNNPLFGIYYVTEGHIKLIKKSYEGQDVITKIANPGDFIGIQGLFNSGKASQSAIALDDAKVCFIERDVMRESIQQKPELYFELTKQLSETLEAEETRVLGLSRKSVRERIAETLLLLADGYGMTQATHSPSKKVINIKLTREELSSLSGTAVETLIRSLSEFKQEKLISIDGREIEIIDRPSMERIAGTQPERMN